MAGNSLSIFIPIHHCIVLFSLFIKGKVCSFCLLQFKLDMVFVLLTEDLM